MEATWLKCTIDSLKAPSKVGYFWKQGDRVKTWKRRWFVLKDKKLFYFLQDKSGSRPKGVVLLEGYTVTAVPMTDVPERDRRALIRQMGAEALEALNSQPSGEQKSSQPSSVGVTSGGSRKRGQSNDISSVPLFMFALIHAVDRRYIFCAEKQVDMQAWVDALAMESPRILTKLVGAKGTDNYIPLSALTISAPPHDSTRYGNMPALQELEIVEEIRVSMDLDRSARENRELSIRRRDRKSSDVPSNVAVDGSADGSMDGSTVSGSLRSTPGEENKSVHTAPPAATTSVGPVTERRKSIVNGRVHSTTTSSQNKETLTCVVCNHVIGGAAIEAAAVHYHLVCFRCTQCSKQLGSSCIHVNGMPHCDACGRRAWIKSQIS